MCKLTTSKNITKLRAFKRLAISLTILLLSGCSQTAKNIIPQELNSPVNTEELQLDEGHGYLLLAVTTNANMQKLFVDGPKDIVLTAKDLQAGTNYIMVALPEGTYELTRMNLAFSSFDFEGEELWKFKVKSNYISYIGDLEAEFFGWFGQQARYNLTNRSSYALQFLESKFPQVLANNRMVYGGFGQDLFLEFVTDKPSLDNAVQDGVKI